ncbi:XylR N-terminal domain-containing protein [Paenibacillus sp. tmac-D7]|uniref:XylR N-terminal domain-containing protein n=1 Tax=Paenibacillus sp. tmac-D7 TaxID=2591462 RepID=UPI0015E830D5|nr:XylR N-terminal domain-containing protein [Paenibacillus sp. tmac-D7]
MRATDLSAAELLSFQSNEGKIFFKDRRTIFVGVDALGTLRKDLISALGMDRAKGFLLRYGWHCGTNDARYVKDVFAWEEETEWLLAGPKIHGVTGNVLAVPIEIRGNRETGEFYSEGYWHHSYEAEQHLEYFGYHHEPVCSTLIGYAGGYGSEFLGKKVIFKEIECIGKGDRHCRYVGKPVEEWDAEINPELPFYKEENLAIELDRAYRRIEKQKEVLSNALSINEKLSKILIQGGGLSTIVKILAQNLRTTVVLEDKNFNLLESFGEYTPHDILTFIQTSGGKQAQRIQRLMDEKRTVHLSVPGQFGWQHERLISPVLLKNEVCGYLSLVKPLDPFDEIETISLQRASTICAVQFLNERTVIEAEQRMKGEFLNELLIENPNVENLSYRMKLMGYDLDKPHYVFVFSLQHRYESHVQQRDTHFMEFKKRIAETIHSQLKSYGRNGLVSTRLDKIISVIPEVLLTQMKLDPKSFGELLVNIVNANYADFRITLGVSSLCKGIGSFRNGYEEANKSIGIAHSRVVKSNVITFDELGSLGIILHAKNAQELESFAMRLLKDLLAYDKEKDAELLKTLYLFLENQGNIHQTSREMMISIGAIRYRLKRIQEISGIDLTRAKDFFDTHLALQILMFYGVFEL